MRTFALVVLSMFLLTGVSVFKQSAFAQSAAAIAEWQTLRPEGEEFTILMPKDSTHETDNHSYIRRELHSRLYLSKTPGGPTFAVVSLNGIKSNPALYTEMARFNSYVDAFRKWFPQKVTGKQSVARLNLVGEKVLNGHTGREYRMIIGDQSGTAHVFATKRAFYAIVSLNSKEDDPSQERFLSSFYLPERVEPPPPPAVAEKAPEKTPTEGEATAKDEKDEEKEEKKEAKVAAADAGETPATKPEDGTAPAANPKQPGKRGPMSAGVLNARALYLPIPDYPPDARAARIGGNVVVQVTVDEYGNVTEAKAASGHAMLQQAAVNAALQARFQPTFLMGEPVKVTGVVTFNFVP